MKNILPVVLLLAGCGGGGGGSDSNSQPPAPLEAVAVTITRAANGCLVSNNADAEVSYTPGVGQAKTLLWSCANINALTSVGVEAFFTFDTAQQCFLQRAVISKAGDCSKRASAPASPVLSTSIRTINPPSMNNIGGGLYALNLDAEVTVTGNLTAVGSSIQVFSTCVGSCPLNSGQPAFFQVDQVGNASVSGSLNIQPGQKITHVFLPIRSGSTTAGDDYTFTMTVLDFFGNGIGSTSFNLTAQ